MPNNHHHCLPAIVVVDSTKDPEEQKPVVIFKPPDTSDTMERKDSKKNKRKPASGASSSTKQGSANTDVANKGSKPVRRHSTTNSSFKKRGLGNNNTNTMSPSPSTAKIKQASIDERSDTSRGSLHEVNKDTIADEIEGKQDSVVSVTVTAPPNDETRSKAQKPPVTPKASMTEEELEAAMLADLDAEIQKSLNKDKTTKKGKAKGKVIKKNKNVKKDNANENEEDQKEDKKETTDDNKEQSPDEALDEPEEDLKEKFAKLLKPSYLPKSKMGSTDGGDKPEEEMTAAEIAEMKAVEKQIMLMIPPDVAKSLSAKEKDKMMKKIVIETVSTAGDRKERSKKKWFKWKYGDDPYLDDELDWLKEGSDDHGWAIGRRIYEKEEIQKVDERSKLKEKSALFECKKYDLKEAPEVFGLWDNVYSLSAVKSLDNAGRWDPGKRERDRKSSRAVNCYMNSSSDEEDADGEKIETKKHEPLDEEEGDVADLDDDDEDIEIDEEHEAVPGKKAVKKKKQKKKNKGGADHLKEEDFKFCLQNTGYDEDGVKKWFASFQTECPSGKLTKNHLHRLFKRIFPIGDSEQFCNHIFRIFDADANNYLDFKEFLQAIDVVTQKSEEEKLQWAFKLYDSNGSGSINVNEMIAIMETMDELEGGKVSEALAAHKEKRQKQQNSGQQRVRDLFAKLDTDGDGEINMTEFVAGYQKLHAKSAAAPVTVTAFVTKKTVEKQDKTGKNLQQPEIKPDMISRRKSFKEIT